jgi:hypothetical protein
MGRPRHALLPAVLVFGVLAAPAGCGDEEGASAVDGPAADVSAPADGSAAGDAAGSSDGGGGGEDAVPAPGAEGGAPRDGSPAAVDARAAAPDGPPFQPMRTYVLTLAAGPFAGSGYPNAVVHFGAQFDPSGPLDLLVYLHGFSNCVLNVVEATGSPCTPGGGARAAYNLIGQTDTARPTAVLIALQLAYDQRSGADGTLAQANGFKNIITEIVEQKLAPVLAPYRAAPLTVGDVRAIAMFSHSGGYGALADVLTVGGMASVVSDAYLLDSLYGDIASFDRWVQQDLPGFDAVSGRRRHYANVYTVGGGTLANSQAQAMRARTAVTAAGLPLGEVYLWDDTTATLGPTDYAHGLLFKRTALAHDAVPTYYFGQLARYAFWR